MAKKFIEVELTDGSTVHVNEDQVQSITRSPKGSGVARINLPTIAYDAKAGIATVQARLGNDVRIIPVTIAAATPEAVILAGVAGTIIELMAIKLSTIAAAAVITIEDEADVNIGGTHHIGAGTAGVPNGLMLPEMGEPWAVTPVNSNLQIENTTGVDIDGIAIVRVVPE